MALNEPVESEIKEADFSASDVIDSTDEPKQSIHNPVDEVEEMAKEAKQEVSNFIDSAANKIKPAIEKQVKPEKSETIILQHPTVRTDATSHLYAPDKSGVMKEIALVLKSGIVKLEWGLEHIRDILVKEGWIDKTKYGREIPTPAVLPVEKRIIEWSFYHPNASETNPVNTDGMGVRGADGNEYLVKVVDNVITTDNPAVAATLIAEKFSQLNVKREP